MTILVVVMSVCLIGSITGFIIVGSIILYRWSNKIEKKKEELKNQLNEQLI